MKPFQNFVVVVVGGIVGTVIGGWILSVMAVNGYVPTKPTSFLSDAAAWVYGTITPANALFALGALTWVASILFRDKLPAWRVKVDIERVQRESAVPPPPMLDFDALNPDGTLKDPTATLSPVTANGRKIMMLFAERNVTSLPMVNIVEALDWSSEQVRSVAGFLNKSDYVRYTSGTMGKMIILTSKGVQYAQRLKHRK